MEEIRRNHNDAKRSLIQSVAHKGYCILDVGCGFGGDLQKWHKCGVNINMCDPEPSALLEARSRAKNMQIESLMWCVLIFLYTTSTRPATSFSVPYEKLKSE